MPRPPRWDAPGTIHHVIVRGIDGHEIFVDDEDRANLMERLDRVFLECRILCLARAFLPNHFHIVVKTATVPVSRAMQRINTGYARHFNARHERRGYVFQGRFRSRLVTDDSYLAAVVRYVLLNPIRHGCIPDLRALERDRWSSVSVLSGYTPPHPVDDVASVLAMIDERPGHARRRLRSWLAVGLGQELPAAEALATGEGQCVSEQIRLGPEACRRVEASSSSSPPSPTFEATGRGPGDLEELAAAICAERRVTHSELCGGSRARRISAARAIFAYRAVCQMGFPVARVASLLGLTSSAVSQSVRRGWEMESRSEVERPPWGGR